MENYLEKYIRAMEESGGRSDNTIAAYYRDARQFAGFLASRQITEPSDIDEACVTAYIEELWRMGRSRSTMNRKLSAVRDFLEFLRELGAANAIAPDIRPPQVKRPAAEFLSVEQVEALLAQPDDSVKGLRDRAILELLYGTGLRVSEIIEMKMEQVNTGIGFCTCGSEHGRARIIPLGKPCRAAVEAYLKTARPQMTEGKKRASADRLFVNMRGEALTRQGLWKIISGYAEAAGIEGKVTPQLLRDSFAVHMLQNGADLRTLQELMGFRDAAALQIYLDSGRIHLKEVFDRAHPRA